MNEHGSFFPLPTANAFYGISYLNKVNDYIRSASICSFPFMMLFMIVIGKSNSPMYSAVQLSGKSHFPRFILQLWMSLYRNHCNKIKIPDALPSTGDFAELQDTYPEDSTV
jgi:predicted nucleic acid-binding Zn finger protein